MKEVGIACHGLSGHQIHGAIEHLHRARLVAFSGVDVEAFNAMRAQFPVVFAGTQRVESIDEVLDNPEVDLVSLCSDRRHDQSEQTEWALDAGKHVLAEKPMATDLQALQQLREAWQASDAHLWSMTSMVYEPAIRGLKQVVDSGALGEIVQVYAMKSYPYYDGRPQDRGVDGGIMQTGIHAFSMIGFVTGLGFGEIVAQDTSVGNPKDGDLQMAANVSCRLSTGALASIVCNYCNPPGIGFWGNDQIRIHGTRGLAELVDGFTRRALCVGEGDPVSFDDDDGPPRYPQDIVNAILDGTPTLLGEEAGFEYTEAALRAQAACAS
ncbi:MAG: Gfo/Idh/MocA family oxidoreductase [Verrucomicrobia bacterium]|nr:Gfo/Idh/MocA family oxidoreductase [Verrucomicrobiota bacterium]MDA1086895.1 Gfo/Idh/MocA family oxidoreductase [Verrucomicrobiota bacterium]